MRGGEASGSPGLLPRKGDEALERRQLAGGRDVADAVGPARGELCAQARRHRGRRRHASPRLRPARPDDWPRRDRRAPYAASGGASGRGARPIARAAPPCSCGHQFGGHQLAKQRVEERHALRRDADAVAAAPGEAKAFVKRQLGRIDQRIGRRCRSVVTVRWRSTPSARRKPISSASLACSLRPSGRSSFEAVALLRHRLQPVLGLPVPQRRVPAAPPVRAGADAGVVPVAPVGEVVAAFLARPRVVADFVGRQARGFGQFAGDVEQVAPPDRRPAARTRPCRTSVAKRVPGSIVS